MNNQIRLLALICCITSFCTSSAQLYRINLENYQDSVFYKYVSNPLPIYYEGIDTNLFYYKVNVGEGIKLKHRYDMPGKYSFMPYRTDTLVIKVSLYRKIGDVLIQSDDFMFPLILPQAYNPEWENLTIGESWTPLKAGEVAIHRNFIYYRLEKQPAPSYQVISINGDTFSSERLRNKLVVMNFWSYGCPPCMASKPALQKLQQLYSENNEIVFLSMFNHDIEVSDESLKFFSYAMKSYHEVNDFGYTNIPNTQHLNPEFNVFAVPVNMIIDRNGIVTLIEIGAYLGDNQELFDKLSYKINLLLKE